MIDEILSEDIFVNYIWDKIPYSKKALCIILHKINGEKKFTMKVKI